MFIVYTQEFRLPVWKSYAAAIYDRLHIKGMFTLVRQSNPVYGAYIHIIWQQIPDVIRGAVLGFTQRAASNTRALDISFGSYGFSTVLAKVFRHVSHYVII